MKDSSWRERLPTKILALCWLVFTVMTGLMAAITHSLWMLTVSIVAFVIVTVMVILDE